jgi:uncharacterized protein YecE (DUF72 family)
MIRVGIGGWTFEPWRTTFFPKGTPKTKELHYASRQLTTIEINGTYYSTQKPTSFKKWHDETPDDFIFSVKANRFCTNRRVLAEAKPSIDHFINSGLTELKTKLGPILWQFMPTKKLDVEDFTAFLALLPKEVGGLPLRHAIDVRHESFGTPEFAALCKKHNVAIVYTHSPKFPPFDQATADFVYARLMGTESKIETGYAPKAIKGWAGKTHEWEKGTGKKKRDVFVYMISGAKERAPAAAMALLKELK